MADFLCTHKKLISAIGISACKHGPAAHTPTANAAAMRLHLPSCADTFDAAAAAVDAHV